MPQPFIGVQVNLISCLSYLVLSLVAIYIHFKALLNLCKATARHTIELSDVLMYIGVWLFNVIMCVLDYNYLLNAVQYVSQT